MNYNLFFLVETIFWAVQKVFLFQKFVLNKLIGKILLKRVAPKLYEKIFPANPFELPLDVLETLLFDAIWIEKLKLIYECTDDNILATALHPGDQERIKRHQGKIKELENISFFGKASTNRIILLAKKYEETKEKSKTQEKKKNRFKKLLTDLRDVFSSRTVGRLMAFIGGIVGICYAVATGASALGIIAAAIPLAGAVITMFFQFADEYYGFNALQKARKHLALQEDYLAANTVVLQQSETIDDVQLERDVDYQLGTKEGRNLRNILSNSIYLAEDMSDWVVSYIVREPEMSLFLKPYSGTEHSFNLGNNLFSLFIDIMSKFGYIIGLVCGFSIYAFYFIKGKEGLDKDAEELHLLRDRIKDNSRKIPTYKSMEELREMVTNPSSCLSNPKSTSLKNLYFTVTKIIIDDGMWEPLRRLFGLEKVVALAQDHIYDPKCFEQHDGRIEEQRTRYKATATELAQPGAEVAAIISRQFRIENRVEDRGVKVGA